MKKISLAIMASVLLSSSAMAAEPEISLNGRRLLSYGTLAVMTGACKTSLTPQQEATLKKGMTAAADEQKDFTPDQFKEIMKSVGSQMASDKDAVCASITPAFVNTQLEEAAAGE